MHWASRVLQLLWQRVQSTRALIFCRCVCLIFVLSPARPGQTLKLGKKTITWWALRLQLGLSNWGQMPVHDEPSRQAYFIYTLLLLTYVVCAMRMHMEVRIVLWNCFHFSSTFLWVPGIKFRVTKVVWQTLLCAISLVPKDLLHTSWVWSGGGGGGVVKGLNLEPYVCKVSTLWPRNIPSTYPWYANV